VYTDVDSSETHGRRHSIFSPALLFCWFLCLVLCFTEQWLLGPSLFVFILGWRYLPRRGEPPVVAAAFTYQWAQVTAALFYLAITGRKITEMKTIDPQPIVLMGLVSICLFFGGYWIVSKNRPDRWGTAVHASQQPLSLMFVSVSYVATVAISQLLLRVAWTLPAITQFLFVLSFARYALLYMLMTRLLSPHPRWIPILIVLVAEVGMGFSGYFASFKDSLAFIGIALCVAAARKRGSAWFALVALAVIGLAAGIAWTAIKPVLRKEYSYSASATERLGRVADALIPALENPPVPWSTQVDKFVSRIWQVYYPALALRRVPRLVPFENGKILRGALSNTFKPRVLFPDKGELVSESELVRKYTGMRVAGRESRTSIAFGYVAESYVDFGWPLLLLPIFLFGCAIGLADRILNRYLTNWEILQSVRVVVLWSSMYLFEASWVIMMGTFVSLTVAVGFMGLMFEKLVGSRTQRRTLVEQTGWSPAS
jgi:hypothetical protein